MRVCPTTRWHCFCANDVMGCVQVHEMHPGSFSGLKNTKNKERYNLECVDVLPECSYVFPGVVPCFAQFILPSRTEQSSKEARVIYSALAPCYEMITLPGLT